MYCICTRKYCHSIRILCIEWSHGNSSFKLLINIAWKHASLLKVLICWNCIYLKIGTTVYHMRLRRRSLEQPILLHKLFTLWRIRQSHVFHCHIWSGYWLLHSGMSGSRFTVIRCSQCENTSPGSYSVRYANVSHRTASEVSAANTKIVWNTVAAWHTCSGATTVTAQLARRASRRCLSSASWSVSIYISIAMICGNFILYLVLKKRSTGLIIGVGKVSYRLGHVYVQPKWCHLYSIGCTRCQRSEQTSLIPTLGRCRSAGSNCSTKVCTYVMQPDTKPQSRKL